MVSLSLTHTHTHTDASLQTVFWLLVPARVCLQTLTALIHYVPCNMECMVLVCMCVCVCVCMFLTRYDALTTEGKLVWQNSVTSLNQPFFDVCDAIFINYGCV